MVPREPRELATVWAQSRVGVEVGAFDERIDLAIREADGDDAVRRIVVALGVVFANPNEAVVRGIDDEIGEAEFALGGDWFGRFARPESPEPLVSVIREVNNARGSRDCAAAVFVDRC